MSVAHNNNRFYQFDDLQDGVIELRHRCNLQGKSAMDRVPAYLFSIVHMRTGDVVGEIDLRLIPTDYLVQFGGQVGYHIDPPYRGRRYAARACLLLQPVALAHQISALWITCNPDNYASQRTCQLIGADFVNEVKIPFASELYWRGDRYKYRYLWDLTKTHSLPH